MLRHALRAAVTGCVVLAASSAAQPASATNHQCDTNQRPVHVGALELCLWQLQSCGPGQVGVVIGDIEMCF